MRTTLTLDDDVYEVAQERAKLCGLPVGKVLSEMARRGLQTARIGVDEHGFPVFVSSPGAPSIDTATVKKLVEEEDLDGALRFARR